MFNDYCQAKYQPRNGFVENMWEISQKASLLKHSYMYIPRDMPRDTHDTRQSTMGAYLPATGPLAQT